MRWLLRLLLSDADRRAVESDLAELFELRRQELDERAATRWLRRQHLMYPLHLLVDRVRAAFSSLLAGVPHLGRDAVHSARSLARTPALTVTILLTVGVGLGATTGMIAIVRAVLVNPLPYAAPDELFWIYTDNPPYRFRFSVVDYRALEADHPAFSAVAAYQTTSVTVTDGGAAERVTAKAVTGSYFPLLGQTALAGRLFDPSDDIRGDRLAVLTAAYWARRFASDPAVLGRTMTIDGTRYTIVGVLQRTVGPLERDVALFTAARWAPPKRKGPFFTMVLGRLRTGVSQAAALDALRATNARLFPIWKSSYQDEKATWGLQDLKSRVVGDVGSTLVVVLAAVACVLLIACVNAINLLIARALTRSRELAIRSALGASRGRILQYLAVESGVLTIGAAGVGVAVAAGAIQLATAYGGGYIPRVDEVRLSAPLVVWLAVLALGSGVLILVGGLVPAIHGSWQMDRSLKSGGRSTTDGPAARRLRRALVAAQFALATPLIVAAVLVLTSLDRLSRVSVGIETERVLTAAVSLSGAGYARDTDRKSFWDRALERVAALPGVEAVALADSRPPNEAGQSNNFDLEDDPTPAGQNQPISTWVGASPGFFSTVGLRLARGRLLDERSLQDDVVVVDRAWADRFFPGQDVLGRRLKGGGCTSCPWTTVVGVVGTVKWVGLEASDRGTVYFPFVDMPNAYIVLRTTADPASLTAALRQAMHELDPGLAVTNVATGHDLVSASLAAPRYLTVLVGMFAAAALVLSVVGIYGVMAHFVQQHARDIGIRLALGGEPSDVRRMVVLQGLRLVVLGVAVGVAAAFLTGRFLTTVLFGVSPTDLRTITGVPMALVALAALACLVPGRRAARLDPAEILRAE
jgi:putative ABC transport system permease protein